MNKSSRSAALTRPVIPTGEPPGSGRSTDSLKDFSVSRAQESVTAGSLDGALTVRKSRLAPDNRVLNEFFLYVLQGMYEWQLWRPEPADQFFIGQI